MRLANKDLQNSDKIDGKCQIVREIVLSDKSDSLVTLQAFFTNKCGRQSPSTIGRKNEKGRGEITPSIIVRNGAAKSWKFE